MNCQACGILLAEGREHIGYCSATCLRVAERAIAAVGLRSFPEGELRMLAAVERVAAALEHGLKLQERITIATEQIVAATASESDECPWCEGGKLMVLRKQGEMPLAMICGYCRGTGKADG